MNRKFLLFGGEGGGLGNFLIFFPAAYYFAALTGREIIIVRNTFTFLPFRSYLEYIFSFFLSFSFIYIFQILYYLWSPACFQVDNSLLGEVCKVILCGYPFLSTMSEAYPEYFTEENMNKVRGVKTFEFRDHLEGRKSLETPILRGDGFKYNSDWWSGVEGANECVQRLTGCKEIGDVACGNHTSFLSLFYHI